MIASRVAWGVAGVVAGLSGLATSYAAARVLTIREAPVVAVSELVIRLTPGDLAERAIQLVGQADKPLLVSTILLLLVLLFALAGVLARSSAWLPLLIWGGLGVVGAVAVLTSPGATPAAALPVVVGIATWIVALALLTRPLRHRPPAQDEEAAAEQTAADRRHFLAVVGVGGFATVAVAGVGRVVGAGLRNVEESRRLLRLEGVTRRGAPAATSIGLDGVTPWRTPNADFYLIHTAISLPTVEPAQWRLRIHGMVDREVTLTYDDLMSRQLTESWITLSCVSNQVGGDLVGNARWSGVRTADVLALAGVSPEADCVLQTSQDGWTCSTPLDALTDERDAMLAVAMNGIALPIEHGFPVRVVVPGLYGYVSATKWVTDFEVTRFDQVEAFWTQHDWSERGPVKIASRIDVPSPGATVPAGRTRVGGVAWHQHTGIEEVEVALDGGPWTAAELAGTPSVDTWVQWAADLDVEPGEHLLRVRATGVGGQVQTGTERDVRPDGATGWHEVPFRVT